MTYSIIFVIYTFNLLGSPKVTMMNFVTKPEGAKKEENGGKPMGKPNLLKVNVNYILQVDLKFSMLENGSTRILLIIFLIGLLDHSIWSKSQQKAGGTCLGAHC